jgi:DNA polymerase-3 subunit epsilon
LNSTPVALDLFPELPQPELIIKKRAAKSPAKVSAKTQQPVFAGAQAGDASGMDLEALARQLEAHPAYRLQRRLLPTLDWPAPAGAVEPGEAINVLVLDTETTGLDAAKERIIELAMLRVRLNRNTGLPVGVVEVYDELEDPGKPIPKEVVALTGIQDSDVAGKKLDEARIAQMLEGVDLVIAHNAGFDRPFVEARLPQFARLRWSCSFADIDWKAQGRSSAKLESLAQAMGWFYDAHRAEMDCHALLAVLAATLPQGGTTGLSRLAQAAELPSFRVQATNAPFDAKDKLKARGYRWNADQRVWHTRVDDEPALQQELEWLKENAYNNRSAVVQVEQLDALAKYSSRPGKTEHRQL